MPPPASLFLRKNHFKVCLRASAANNDINRMNLSFILWIILQFDKLKKWAEGWSVRQFRELGGLVSPPFG